MRAMAFNAACCSPMWVLVQESCISLSRLLQRPQSCERSRVGDECTSGAPQLLGNREHPLDLQPDTSKHATGLLKGSVQSGVMVYEIAQWRDQCTSGKSWSADNSFARVHLQSGCDARHENCPDIIQMDSKVIECHTPPRIDAARWPLPKNQIVC